MWLLFFFILISTVSGQNQLANSQTYLNGAMTGFDIFYMRGFTTSNPGKRSLLFQPLRTVNGATCSQAVTNSFINNEEETECFPDITVQKIVNYKDFQDFLSSTAYEVSYEENWGTPVLHYENFTSCKTKEGRKDRAVLQFFKETGGGLVVAYAQCVTHTVTIAPFEPITFTPAFQTALVTLYKAAVSPSPEIRNETYSTFVKYYGTHFSRRTLFGSRAIFVKLFSTRAATFEEETAQRRCVEEAAQEALTAGTRMNNETTLMHFTRTSSQRCKGGEDEAMVAITGPLPEYRLENWASIAKMSPKPIYHELEPLSTLFKHEWFKGTLQEVESEINATILQEYFEEYSSDYSIRMACGGSNRATLRGCGLSSYCRPETECLNDPDSDTGYTCVPIYAPGALCSQMTPPPTTDPSTVIASATERVPTGGIIIVGGRQIGWTYSTQISTALYTTAPPSLPGKVGGNTLSAVGSHLYSCGGEKNNLNVCWEIDTNMQDTTWRSVSIQWELRNHCAVAVQDEIWFFKHSKLMIFHTKNSVNKFRELVVGFSFGHSMCALRYETKTFLIGAGPNITEIYVNTDSSTPEQWKIFSHLRQGRKEFGCLVFGDEIIVTGGRNVESSTVLASVEAISLVNGSGRSLGPLSEAKYHHKMAIIQGRPAVLGGYDRTALATIETYDEQTNSWETMSDSLGEPRFLFGMTQNFP